MRSCHPECRRFHHEIKGEFECFRRKHGRPACYFARDSKRWIKISRRTPSTDSTPFLIEFHQHIPHKIVVDYPTFHVKQSDAILDPHGNELWLGVVCERNHGYDARTHSYQQCFALVRRVQAADMRLIFAEALIDLMPEDFDDEGLIRAIADALMGDPYVRTKLIREASRVQASNELESPAWLFAQYARIAADHFDRHREEHSRESLLTLRELYLAVEARDPKAAARIAQATPLLDEKCDYFATQAKLLVRLYKRLSRLPQTSSK